MSDREFERAVTDWLDDGIDRTPASAIDGVLLAVKTTPQERDLWIPWRIPMPVFSRAIGIAVAALVVVVGAGTLFYMNANRAGGVGATAPSPTASPTATPNPTPNPTPASTASPSDSASPGQSFVAPGITGWTPFTSTVYGYTLSYPTGWNGTPATRAWQPSDGSSAIERVADLFGSPDNELGVAVWQMPAGDGADIQSTGGLKAWATAFCRDQHLAACDTFTDRAEPMCLNAGGDPCRAALLVRSDGSNPADSGEYAFFPDWTSVMLTGSPDKVTVAMVGRGDAYPAAASYGGAVQLLKSMLSTMGVTTP